MDQPEETETQSKKFRRQHSIGPYIVDFFCPECRLAIELDGAAHITDNGNEADERRSEFLKRFNVRIIRFENKAVFEDLEGVLEDIRRNLNGSHEEPPRLAHFIRSAPLLT